MSEQPHEWTPEYVDNRLLTHAVVPWKIVCRIADAHNAALAAADEHLMRSQHNHFVCQQPTGKMSEQPQECKLGPAQRYEVNSLMEAAQDDLESVLFQLVWQREKAEAALAAERDEKEKAIEAWGNRNLKLVDQLAAEQKKIKVLVEALTILMNGASNGLDRKVAAVALAKVKEFNDKEERRVIK